MFKCQIRQYRILHCKIFAKKMYIKQKDIFLIQEFEAIN